MRILYGVVGEGMGHATRSRVLLEELVKAHEVHIVVSGRAREYLARRFDNVHAIWGLTLSYEGNSVRTWQTVLQNVKGALSGWPQNVRAYLELAEKFEPEVVISDFESFSYLFAKAHLLPVISIDNMQIINRCSHDASLLAGYEDSFEATRSVVKAKLPLAYQYLVTTFFRPPVRKERTTLLPPILRAEILGAKPERGEHLLVYQTATTNSELPALLAKLDVPCRIYGLRRDLTSDVHEGKLMYRPFSEERFIDDLRTARGVVAGGGFTLMSEAVYLHKPMLSSPLGHQFEQTINALYLEKLGYGLHAPTLSLEKLGEFLERTQACEQALYAYSQDGNRELIGTLERTLVSARADGGLWAKEEP